MGLDTYLFKPIPKSQKTDKHIWIYSLEIYPQLKCFAHLAYEKESTVYYHPELEMWVIEEFLVDEWYYAKGSLDYKIVTTPVINCIEYSWARKGASKKFYEDEMWNLIPYITKTEMKQHFDLYFSDKEHRKWSWKKSIYDRFVDGEHFWIYM